MSSKTTMKDIAKVCGVSLATVSYVLNNSEKEHISHDTRLKVLDVANQLNYIPNLTARSLANKKSNLIGIIINLGHKDSPSKKLLYYDLAFELHKELARYGYDTIITSTKDFDESGDIISKRSLDATFIIDVDVNSVKQTTTKYYVPIIFLECSIDDDLFCKVYSNYSVIISQAKRMLHSNNIYLVMENIINEKIKKEIISKFANEDVFINTDKANLQEFLENHKNTKGLVIGDLLGAEVERYVNNDDIVVLTSLETNMLLPTTKTLSIKNKTKAKAAVDILQRLLRLDYETYKGNKLLLNPDFN